MRIPLSSFSMSLVILCACAPLTEENAAERLAISVCKKERACDTNGWDDVWDRDYDACVDGITDALELAQQVGGFFGLDVDLDEVRACRREIGRAPCAAWEDGSVTPACDGLLSF